MRYRRHVSIPTSVDVRPHEQDMLLDLPMGAGFGLRIRRCRVCWILPYQALMRTPTSQWEIVRFSPDLEGLIIHVNALATEIRDQIRRADGASTSPVVTPRPKPKPKSKAKTTAKTQTQRAAPRVQAQTQDQDQDQDQDQTQTETETKTQTETEKELNDADLA